MIIWDVGSKAVNEYEKFVWQMSSKTPWRQKGTAVGRGGDEVSFHSV